MNEWLTLLAGPALAVYAQRRRGTVTSVHGDLRAMIAAQPGIAVTDAGEMPVLAVARALELPAADLPPSLPEPRPPRRAGQDAAWEARETIRPLGLELVDVVRVEPRAFASGALVRGRTEMAGERYGRRVVVRLEEASSVVEICGDFPSFALSACAQRWERLGDAPPPVARWLAGLEPSRRWDGVRVECDSGGLRLMRDLESTRSWMHDLWLAEQLADAACCAAGVPA